MVEVSEVSFVCPICGESDFQTPHTQYGASLYIEMCVCACHFFGSMNFSQNPLIVSSRQSLSSTSRQQTYLMSMFHHSLYSQHNSRNPYLNKSLIVPQNDNFFKNLFNRKYVKFIIKLMSKNCFLCILSLILSKRYLI